MTVSFLSVVKVILGLFMVLVFIGCNSEVEHKLIKDLAILSSDDFEGRKPGSEGSVKARGYILSRLNEMNAIPFKESFVDSFDLRFIESEISGANIQAVKKGINKKEKFIVVSAHYDHLGIRDNEIYNGANDNATGVSVLLGLISELEDYSLNNSVVFLFLDAEEFGKDGVNHFLNENTEIHDEILLNFNIDMLNCKDESDLYLCGTKYHPLFKQILSGKVNQFGINFGHDGEDPNKKSWLESSDHSVFTNWGIPFLYFGSEEERFYNTPQDDFGNINLECFIKTLEMAKEMIIELDKNLK